MPLPWYDDDRCDDVMRVEFSCLESEEWWRSLRLDGLVLYSWGAPRYRRIARAVHRAGIHLVVHLDSSGHFYGLFAPGTPWWRKLYVNIRGLGQDFLRARHLRYADIVTMSAPTAEHLRHRLFYGEDIVEKCYPMPCPIMPECCYDGTPKLSQILCVGRWDDVYQKRPEVLKETLDSYYSAKGTAKTLIYGRITQDLKQWHANHPAREHILLMGNAPHSELTQAYRRSQVLLCTSLYESSHIVSAEALCCGCSVVTPPRAEDLRCVLWYTTKDSGTISKDDSPISLARALQHELDQWQDGKRDPAAIAAEWSPHFHIDRILKEIFNLGTP